VTAKKAAPVTKATATKAAAKAAPAKAATKTAAEKVTATTAAPVTETPVTETPVTETPPPTPAGLPTPAPKPDSAATSDTARPTTSAPAPAVPPGSEWTEEELAAVRQQLMDELTEMRNAYDVSMRDLDNLQRSSTDGAGDDQADAGSKTFEREQEQSIAANRRDLITQIQHAVERIDSGTYGYCESCGRPIPKARLKAFPAATLDVACKQREERR
jgi:RNA polymerase-binding protein DksA